MRIPFFSKKQEIEFSFMKISARSNLFFSKIIPLFKAQIFLSVWTFYSMDIFYENGIFVKDFFLSFRRKKLEARGTSDLKIVIR